MLTPSLETERLILKPLSSDDSVQIQRIFPRWEIVRYLVASIPWPYPDNAAQDYVDNVALVASNEGKGWYWTLRRKENPRNLIGVICLMDNPDNHRGFWLAPEWQGQGYMTEACRAVTCFWFIKLGRQVLRVSKAVINSRSRKLSERSGMRLIRVQKNNYVCGELETEIWEITRDEWSRLNGELD
ncbi:GNAT family N-acetyltransferase [Salmonella enterica]|nr:GNAT family N-acetyltransferase [Salmonella enterica]MIV19165.1 N-acetyltransferase [Salmonella enterica]